MPRKIFIVDDDIQFADMLGDVAATIGFSC